MKAETKQALLLAALAFAVIWNSMCLTGIFPIDKWPVSTGVVCIANLFTLIPLLFQSGSPKEEKTAYTADRRQKDRIMIGILICLAVAWIVTMIVCLFVS